MLKPGARGDLGLEVVGGVMGGSDVERVVFVRRTFY